MMERIPTGIAQLDQIVGGGLPTGSLLVIAGAPGTGKTILAQQICFANATAEHKAIYYTTLSEPHTKIMRHLESFKFFDPSALGNRIEFQHLVGGHADNLEALMSEVVRKSFEVEPIVVVIDSARALQEGAGREHFRETVYDLASRVAHTNALLIFVGEYAIEDLAQEPEFAVADGIIYLSNEADGATDTRKMRVVKMRGSTYVSGTHTFAIGSEGMQVYPRFEATPIMRRDREEGRAPFGIPHLDDMTCGGLPIRSSTLIGGPSGVGKTVLSLSFVGHGLARGKRCLYLSLQESEEQLLSKAAAFGFDLAAARESGQLRTRHIEPIELGLDAVGRMLREEVETFKPDRAVLDSVAELQHASRGSSRFADYLWALVEMFRSGGATTIYTNETAAFFGPAFELAGGLSYVFDNIMVLRYTELESEIRRALTVVKMRESDHEKSLVEFDVGPDGFVVGEKFAGMSGVLTGTPIRVERKFRDFFEE
jgi:circadian clock protein KaiC